MTNYNNRIKNLFLVPVLTAGFALLLAGPVTAQTFTTLHSFTTPRGPGYTNDDGNYPSGTLLVVGDSLYGTAVRGGTSSEGDVFALNLDGSAFTTLYSFTNINDAGYPAGGLVSAGNALYGTTEFSGFMQHHGGIYAVNQDGTGFRYLHIFGDGDFNGSPGYFVNSDGAGPECRLLLSDNVLYGTTITGGANGSGTVFAVNTDGTGFRLLHVFGARPVTPPASNDDGGSSVAELVIVGKTLYGTAGTGGNPGFGVIFAVDTDGTNFKVLHAFAGPDDGAMPHAGLTVAGSALYGVTSDGGPGGSGTIFSIGLDGTGFKVLHSFSALPPYPGPFTNSDGAAPQGTLVLSGNTLYGSASSGGAFASGALFAINTDGTGFKNLYSFSELPPFAGGSAPFPTNSDGAKPIGGLAISNGVLYGSASQGGGFGYGSLFSLSLPVPPAPAIAASGSNLILTWPANAALTLQSTTDIGSPTWTRVSTSPVTVNGQNSVTVPMSGKVGFYRLSR